MMHSGSVAGASEREPRVNEECGGGSSSAAPSEGGPAAGALPGSDKHSSPARHAPRRETTGTDWRPPKPSGPSNSGAVVRSRKSVSPRDSGEKQQAASGAAQDPSGSTPRSPAIERFEAAAQRVRSASTPTLPEKLVGLDDVLGRVPPARARESRRRSHTELQK